MNFRPHVLILMLLVAVLVNSVPYSDAAESQKNYYVYVDPLPDYATITSDVIFDAAARWEKVNPGIKFNQATSLEQADVEIQWIKEYGETVGEYRPGEHTILVALGNSNCLGKWQPFAYSFVTNIAQHELGHFLGLGHSNDPANIMYPIAPGFQYGQIEIERDLTPNYWWFVPACTTDDNTSYTFQINTSEPKYGFDVYFVPSINEGYKYTQGQQIQYYSDSGCFGKNFLSFSGSCAGIAKRGGLLVIMPKQLTDASARVTVRLLEKSTGPESLPITPSVGAQQVPTPSPTPSPIPTPTPTPAPAPPPPTIGSFKAEQEEYIVPRHNPPTEVKINGVVNDPKGGKVILTITRPDGSSEVREAYITSKGQFLAPILLDKDSPEGQYLISADYNDSYLGLISFNVISKDTLPSKNTSIQNQQTKPAASIPSWIKNNAKWWSHGLIGDRDFVQGIQYLIQQKIIKVPETKIGSTKAQQIPSWVKNNAGWWSNGMISDDDFVKGIQYLIANGIMKV